MNVLVVWRLLVLEFHDGAKFAFSEDAFSDTLMLCIISPSNLYQTLPPNFLPIEQCGKFITRL